MSTGKPKASDLSSLRQRIDEVDDRLLTLLKQRMEIVADVAAYKKRTGTQIRDHRRERELLDGRRDRATALGLAAEPVEAIYRQIMLASRDYQAALGAAAPAQQVPRRVVVVGGHGAMGRLLATLFTDLGHEVSTIDVDSEGKAADLVRAAEVVVVSVPIDLTCEVIAELGPHVSPDALLFDVTSVKTEPVSAMLEATEASGASVVGCHPMFGPNVHSLMGQRVVLCAGRGQRWFEWLKGVFETRGLTVTETTPKAHDRAMALVQVLTHFQTQVFGIALARSGVPLAESLRFTSPAYLMELYVAARHFAQAPELYGPIEMLNPETDGVTTAFCQVADELAQVLARRDRARFTELFSEVRAFFGDFSIEATEQSKFLIDRLLERALG
ncbi:MAG: bifunctional chorismate mutase/prephenate dehydrogenase [Myxococcales bacterium]|nr:bifunctional chorismate mutase/prephenate dehydrogenase [Myxococcales bacterium]MDD9970365.1 bifunctional chorismate mutase/prephenate dehydrogenase [Myxococcales bacterium]